MKTVELKISDNAFEKVLYFLKHLPKQDVQIFLKEEDFDTLPPELEKELHEMITDYKNGKKDAFISLEEFEKSV